MVASTSVVGASWTKVAEVQCASILAAMALVFALLMFTSAPAFAAGEPEAPITEVCHGPIFTLGEICGTLNPHSKSKVGFYFAYNKGSSCRGGEQAFGGPEAEVQDEEVSARLTGLEANTQYTYCLVATNHSGETYGGTVSFVTAPVAPMIEGVSATRITDDSATLEAQISPENSETEYELLIADPCGGPPDCILSTGKIPSTTAHETVKVELASKEHLNLEPDTTYEYWIVAKNSDAQKTEVRKTFTTLKTPSIDSESVSGVTEHDGTLQATIGPEGQDVRYQFQVVRSPSEYPPEMACPSASNAEICIGSPPTTGALPIGFVAAGTADDSVILDLASAGVTLQPDTTYHYRVITVSSPMTEDTIEWSGPQVYGADQTFTTPGPPASSSSGGPSGGGGSPGTPTGTVSNAFVLAGIASFAKDGKLRLTLTLPGPGTLQIVAEASTAQLADAARTSTTRHHPKRSRTTTVVIARARLVVSKAGRTVVTLPLTRKARSMLAKQGKLRATVTITYTPTGGTSRSTTRTVTFSLKRRH